MNDKKFIRRLAECIPDTAIKKIPDEFNHSCPTVLTKGQRKRRREKITQLHGSETFNRHKRQAGDYQLGPLLGSSPVKSMISCLARRKGTDNFYIMKILTIKERDEDQDDRQGKMLLHTEHSLLELLQGEEGVIQQHGLFEDYAAEYYNGDVKIVRRVCLVLDCLFRHNYCSKSREYINLQHYIIWKKRLHEEEALVIFAKIVDIVRRLHKKNVVHRDIKLANLFYNSYSQEVYLTNFCLGQHLVTENDILLDQRGSPAYISPDILTGKPYLGKPSDMWALGVVLYTMLFGQFPFYHEQHRELFLKIRSATFTFPPPIEVHEDTKSLIRHLLAQNPSKRLTAEEACDVLKYILKKKQKAYYPKPFSEDQIVPLCDETEFETEEEKWDKKLQEHEAKMLDSIEVPDDSKGAKLMPEKSFFYGDPNRCSERSDISKPRTNIKFTKGSVQTMSTDDIVQSRNIFQIDTVPGMFEAWQGAANFLPGSSNRSNGNDRVVLSGVLPGRTHLPPFVSSSVNSSRNAPFYRMDLSEFWTARRIAMSATHGSGDIAVVPDDCESDDIMDFDLVPRRARSSGRTSSHPRLENAVESFDNIPRLESVFRHFLSENLTSDNEIERYEVPSLSNEVQAVSNEHRFSSSATVPNLDGVRQSSSSNRNQQTFNVANETRLVNNRNQPGPSGVNNRSNNNQTRTGNYRGSSTVSSTYLSYLFSNRIRSSNRPSIVSEPLPSLIAESNENESGNTDQQEIFEIENDQGQQDVEEMDQDETMDQNNILPTDIFSVNSSNQVNRTSDRIINEVIPENNSIPQPSMSFARRRRNAFIENDENSHMSEPIQPESSVWTSGHIANLNDGMSSRTEQVGQSLRPNSRRRQNSFTENEHNSNILPEQSQSSVWNEGQDGVLLLEDEVRSRSQRQEQTIEIYSNNTLDVYAPSSSGIPFERTNAVSEDSQSSFQNDLQRISIQSSTSRIIPLSNDSQITSSTDSLSPVDHQNESEFMEGQVPNRIESQEQISVPEPVNSNVNDTQGVPLQRLDSQGSQSYASSRISTTQNQVVPSPSDSENIVSVAGSNSTLRTVSTGDLPSVPLQLVSSAIQLSSALSPSTISVVTEQNNPTRSTFVVSPSSDAQFVLTSYNSSSEPRPTQNEHAFVIPRFNEVETTLSSSQDHSYTARFSHTEQDSLSARNSPVNIPEINNEEPQSNYDNDEDTWDNSTS